MSTDPFTLIAESTRIFWESHVAAEVRSRRCYMDLCESPIEKVFFAAWTVGELERTNTSGADGCSATWSLVNCVSDPRAHLESSGANSKELTVIRLQHPIGNYRADFVIERVGTPVVGGKYIVAPKFVVECDGHDFHEKTKEQAQRDKSRDRELQSQGYYVLRFTGSEIWRDPMKCVRQVNEAIDAAMQKIIHEYVSEWEKEREKTEGDGA